MLISIGPAAFMDADLSFYADARAGADGDIAAIF
jgi:hypothetical protein